jgi:hypothetical protein
MLEPSNVRSAHISLMLYGFIPLMLSYLPFLLLHKDLGVNPKALKYLELYAIFWYTFLIIMTISLLMGVTRDLAFYDFHYSLNAVLAFSGLFYILALYEYIRMYRVKPLWVKVSLAVVIVAPFALLFLMNPVVGQVEATVSGPHGDNTLGMSLALIPIYYLIIKFLSKEPFKARWNIFWIVPAFFYLFSVIYRSFIGHLSYDAEWFCQWLTLLYIPLLWRWYRDAKISNNAKLFLLVSIVAFLFVDVEGNILFIPSIRWQFHRNDLVIAHAHIAMGVGVMFMTLALYAESIKRLYNSFFLNQYLFGMFAIFTPLTLNGFVEAGYMIMNTQLLWIIRSLGGIFIISSFFYLIIFNVKPSRVQWYNLGGVLNDGFGGLALFLTASYFYPRFGLRFEGVYEYVVFGFVMTTGLLHSIAYIYRSELLTLSTALIRLFIGGIFLSLFLAHKLGFEALVIFGFDFLYASLFLVWLYRPAYLQRKENV